MPNYNVHLFVVVRLKIENFQADSPAEAARRAVDFPEICLDLARGAGDFDGVIDGVAVDPLDSSGNPLTEQSVWFEGGDVAGDGTPTAAPASSVDAGNHTPAFEKIPMKAEQTKFVTTVSVLDPDTNFPVKVEIRKCPNGPMLGLDGSWLESTDENARSPYEPDVFYVIPDNEPPAKLLPDEY